MERALRLIVDLGVDSAAGLALDEALLRWCEESGDGVLRLYTYRDHAVLVGRYQRIEAEVDLDEVIARHLDLNRRPTGGGTIVMGSGQLGIALVFKDESPPSPRRVLESFGNAIARTLAVNFGIKAELAGKNDLEVDGRKVAGLGIYRLPGGATLCHASVLGDLDTQMMVSVLRTPAVKLLSKLEAEVARRTVTLSQLLGRTVSGADLIEEFAKTFPMAIGATEVREDRPNSHELAIASELRVAKYIDSSWILSRDGVTPSERIVTFRTTFGTVQLVLRIAGAAIRDALVTGDFIDSDPRLIGLPKALRWQPLSGTRLAEVVSEVLGDAVERVALDDAFAGIAAMDAAPIRVGSCYIPEGSMG
jgi:lipoate-protein ligase A